MFAVGQALRLRRHLLDVCMDERSIVKCQILDMVGGMNEEIR